MCDKKKDHGKHYRFVHTVNLREEDRKRGFVHLKLDPFMISKIYGDIPAPQFTILKKVLVPGKRGSKTEVQDLRDIICAAERAIEMIGENE